jgi:hypothetical protein
MRRPRSRDFSALATVSSNRDTNHTREYCGDQGKRIGQHHVRSQYNVLLVKL